jgi:octanoyl-[GcvH]:protein N-octanoyltransferase
MRMLPKCSLNDGDDVYYPFAYEELVCKAIGARRMSGPLLHVWQHPRAFVLGMRDSRLPHARTAMDWLAAHGFCVMVRNSGGAAVPLDLGVVNMTLIQANDKDNIDIREDFGRLVLLLQQVFRLLQLPPFHTGEIAGAYCPGEFDLSIQGRKFCGLAQRRLQGASMVQAFVNVEGDAFARSEWVRHFYAIAEGETTKIHHETMGSLTDLAGENSVGVQLFLDALSSIVLPPLAATDPQIEVEAVHEIITQFKRRYDPRYPA